MTIDDIARAQISKFEEKLAPIEAQLEQLVKERSKWRTAINLVLEANEEPPQYPDESGEPASIVVGSAVRRKTYGRAEFYDQPLATAVARLIEDNGPLDEREIFDLLSSGGFKFSDPNPDRARSNVKISLGKNSRFDRTPMGHYVIAPSVKQRKTAGRQGVAGDQPSDNGATASPSVPDTEPEA